MAQVQATIAANKAKIAVHEVDPATASGEELTFVSAPLPTAFSPTRPCVYTHMILRKQCK